jgi:hypothetical protein
LSYRYFLSFYSGAAGAAPSPLGFKVDRAAALMRGRKPAGRAGKLQQIAQPARQPVSLTGNISLGILNAFKVHASATTGLTTNNEQGG